MRPRKAETHTLTGAYALHALTGTDAARFERHLGRCPACAQEISEFTEATARLATAAAALPPATLKHRVLAAAARTRQLPPATREPAAAWTARHATATRSARRASTAGLPGRPRARRLALTAAGAVLVLAAILGVTARTAQDRLGQNLARSQQIATVLTAPDATMLDARVTTGGTATVVMSRHQHALVFAAAGLPPLPPSRCYELWLLTSGGDKPAGLSPAPRQDKTGPVITTGLAPAGRLGLTIEPALRITAPDHCDDPEPRPVTGQTPETANDGPGVPGRLATIRQSDGAAQATYDGHPLHAYVGDAAPGQAFGNGLSLNGGLWHQVTVPG